MTPDEARASLASLDLDPAALDVLFAHFADCEARGKHGHGFSRIPWLVEQPFDFGARALKRSSVDGVDRWDGNGALGYLTLSAVCDDLLAEGSTVCASRSPRRASRPAPSDTGRGASPRAATSRS